jgi:hypothetical protein
MKPQRLFRCGKSTWPVSDRYERLVTVMAQVLLRHAENIYLWFQLWTAVPSRAVEAVV